MHEHNTTIISVTSIYATLFHQDLSCQHSMTFEMLFERIASCTVSCYILVSNIN